MAYEIIWSENSLQDYREIIEYLMPFLGIKSNKNPSIRSLLLTSHNRLYYSISENMIELLAIIDTRSNPEKNPF